MISLNGIKITPTIFPDGSSQVWKLPAKLLERVYKEYIATVLWEFENEAEFLHVAQIKTLLDTYTPVVNLECPFLPFGRQDKRVDNDSTFALTTFACLLNSLSFNQVTTIDAHNNPRANMINNLVDQSPQDFIEEAIGACKPEAVLFPDYGAKIRYMHSLNYKGQYIYAFKDRDQSTGDIQEIQFDGNVKGLNILVCDDICDGGRTFKIVAELALKRGAKEVHLFVTHGLFTKGIQTLRDSGIKRIFTRRGEVK